jgi:drug/metabolite transporter (DMT)-like permease
MILLAPAACAGLAASLALGTTGTPRASAWIGIVYASVVSMFLGSVAWYRGLASGGTARIGRLNLAQPLLTIAWSALLLGESISWATPATATLVLACMAVCLRTGRAPASPRTAELTSTSS